MPVQQVFKRYEKKYLLTADQEKKLLEAVDGRMIMDQYGEHIICNIYFDDDIFSLTRHSLDKPLYKEKLRLRTYGVPEDENHTAFVEIKKKFDGVVYKRRVSMKLKTAEKYLYEGIHPKKDSQILREIDWFLKLHAPVKPKVVLTYKRRAFYEKDFPDFRMTIDRDITCRYDDLDLKHGVKGEKLLADGISLLEIKIPGKMPLWMSKLLSELKIFPASFSKVGTYYKSTPELNRIVK
ncbi:MAG: polyphosphate polymerase domain-containing protein [Lachnospiraceae bacterium]|nr:polyphosphate polymerase domain-containing protein [Lachnospiraceae bacterium]